MRNEQRVMSNEELGMRNFINHEPQGRCGFFRNVNSLCMRLIKYTRIFLLVFLFSGVFIYSQDVAVFPQLGHNEDSIRVLFSPNGKHFLSYGGSVKLWDIKSGREIRTFNTGTVTAIDYSPDGKKIVVSTEAGTLNLWDVESGKKIRTFKGKLIDWSLKDGENSDEYGETYCINFVKFSSDGTKILSGVIGQEITYLYQDGKNEVLNCLRLWDEKTGLEII